jgi:hypothetical protein
MRKNGASILGKAGGVSKARNNAKAAAEARWAHAKKDKEKGVKRK